MHFTFIHRYRFYGYYFTQVIWACSYRENKIRGYWASESDSQTQEIMTDINEVECMECLHVKFPRPVYEHDASAAYDKV